jgi:hypothetical protein
MDSHSVAKVLLVRSVEESAPELLDGEALLDAAVHAGAIDDPRAWLVRRAEHVLKSLPDSYQVLLEMTESASGGVWIALGASVLVGLFTNYLGPSQSIHAFYNPISLLILWNLAVFLGLAFGRLMQGRASGQIRDSLEPVDHQDRLENPAPPRTRRRRSLALWLLRRTVPRIWVRSHKLLTDSREESAQMAGVAKNFWGDWVAVMQPLFRLRTRRLLNFAAIGLAFGAVLGMFVRGLFLDYHIVWRSTFITDPQTVAAVLNVFVGLPALLLGRAAPSAETATALMGPKGVDAGEWILLYAGAAALFILIPRSVLAAVHALRLRALAQSLDVEPDDPHFSQLIRLAREQRVDQIRSAIKADVRVESAKFADGIATYVCETLYDRRIVPRLERFREEGGRLQELETAVEKDCADFESELNDYFPKAQAEFEQGLSRAITRTVQGDAKFETTAQGLGGDVHQASSGAALATGQTIGAGLNTIVGTTVSTAVALVLATISGGFGESLGVALALALGTTGPVGFLIGGLVGLVIAGGGYFLGRERASGAIKSIALPGRVVRIALRANRLNKLVTDGRSKCHDSVESLIKERLEPVTPQIADQIWTQVKPVIGARHRLGSAS